MSSIREAKTISSAFDAHMGIFVDAQDKSVTNIMVVANSYWATPVELCRIWCPRIVEPSQGYHLKKLLQRMTELLLRRCYLPPPSSSISMDKVWSSVPNFRSNGPCSIFLAFIRSGFVYTQVNQNRWSLLIWVSNSCLLLQRTYWFRGSNGKPFTSALRV